MTTRVAVLLLGGLKLAVGLGTDEVWKEAEPVDPRGNNNKLTTYQAWQARAEKHSTLCLRAHTLRVGTALWQEHTSECDRCNKGGLHDEKSNLFVETYRFIFDLMDIIFVAGTIEQAEQPNYLAERQIPL
eukprot:1156230-Pelagomonas_calceolata.AAC.1